MLMSKEESLKRTKIKTEEYCERYRKNPAPIVGEVKQSLFKAFSYAMSELSLMEFGRFGTGSYLATYLQKRIKPADRQKFLNILDKALTIIESYNMGKIQNLPNTYVRDIYVARTVLDVADTIIKELYPPLIQEQQKVYISKKDEKERSR